MIILASYDAGGGISHFTNRIYNVLQKEYNQIKLYITKNSSSYVFFKILLYHKPTIVIIHDYFPFLIQSAAHYKIVNPKSKLVFISLCKAEPPDGLELFDDVLLPSSASLHYARNDHFVTSKSFYYPLNRDLKKIKKWKDRKAFIYVGRIEESKISLKLIELLNTYNITIDVYGNIKDIKYYEKLSTYRNFNYKGFAPHYKLVHILNKYKYHLLSSQTDCFSIISLEAAACGTIPIFVNCHNKLEWAKNISFTFSTSEFEKIMPLLMISDLENFSTKISKHVRLLYNEDSFLKLFKEIRNDKNNRGEDRN